MKRFGLVAAVAALLASLSVSGAPGTSYPSSGSVALGAFGSTPNAKGASVSGSTLTLQPADGTHPGLVSTTTQTFGGAKTFSSTITLGNGLTTTGGDIIGNDAFIWAKGIGQLISDNKEILLNYTSSAASGGSVGVGVYENTVLKGYAKTSADRNSWELVAPNTVGTVTITPGSSGFTISQGSHDALTLAAVGSSPSANGASLSSQVLTLQPVDATHPGVVTTGSQTIAGIKTFSSAPNLSSLTASLPLKLDASKNVTSAAISIASGSSEITGTLAASSGGTGQSSLTANNVILGNGTSGVLFIAPGTSGNVLTSNGTTWQSTSTAINETCVLDNDAGAGSNNTHVRNFTTNTDTGSGCTSARSATNGASITINTGGVWTFCWNGPRFSATDTVELTNASTSFVNTQASGMLALADTTSTALHGYPICVTDHYVGGGTVIVRAVTFTASLTANGPTNQYLRAVRHSN